MEFLLFLCLAGCLVCFILERKHFLVCLLAMEGTMLCVLIGLLVICQSAAQMFLSVCVIVLVAMEGAVGLSILVSMSRKNSSDYVMA